jgi:hypothetical protein
MSTEEEVSKIMKFSQPPDSAVLVEPIDGPGAGDHDQPYRFGWRPRADVPFPFNTREYARLLVLRSRLHDNADRLDGIDDTGSLLWAA